MGCDCIGVISSDTSDLEGGDDRITPGIVCSGDMRFGGCRQAEASHPVLMDQINGKRICGKGTGFNFMEMHRPQANLDGTHSCVELDA